MSVGKKKKKHLSDKNPDCTIECNWKNKWNILRLRLISKFITKISGAFFKLILGENGNWNGYAIKGSFCYFILFFAITTFVSVE